MIVAAALLLVGLGLPLLPSSPAAAATTTSTVTGTVSATGTSWRTHPLTLNGPSQVVASLDWDDNAANLSLFFRNGSGANVASSASNRKPESITYTTVAGGAWSFGVKAAAGSTGYTLTIKVTDVAAPGTVSGRVWPDTNGNGVQDAGETGSVAGATVRALSAGVVVASTTTTSGSGYQLAVPAGSYVIEVSAPTTGRWAFSPQGAGADSGADSDVDPATRRSGAIDVAEGSNATIDAGLVAQASVRVPTYARTIGGPSHAELYPSGLDVDADGTIYVADTGNDAVVAYSSGRQRLWSSSKRGQTKGLGSFDNPRDVAVLGDNLYVVDAGNQRVQVLRKSDGVATAVWSAALGSPIGISAGTGADGAPVLLVAESTGHRVSQFTPQGVLVQRFGTGVAGAANGQLNGPRDAATDSNGRVYVADYLNNRIVVFRADRAWLANWGTTGTGPGNYVRPYGVDVDDSDRIYVADSNNYRVQVLNQTGTQLAQVGSRGRLEGQFEHLRRVAVGSGTLPTIYAADLWQWKIEVFASPLGAGSGVSMGTIGGQAPETGGFNQPSGLAVDSNNVFVVDSVNQRAQRFSTSAPEQFEAAFGNRGWGLDLEGFNWPRSIAIDATNNSLWLADTKNSRIIETDRDGLATGRILGSYGSGATQMNWPLGVRAAGGKVFVADTQNHRVQAWDPQTRTVAWTATGVTNPWDLTVVGNTVYVTDTGGKRIVLLNATTGSFVRGFGATSLHYPTGVAVTAAGHVWVADKTWNQIVEFDENGTFVQKLGSLGTTHGRFNTPSRVAVHGNTLYVTDVYNDRIELFNLGA